MTSTAFSSLQQVDDESLRKFMDRFDWIVVQIGHLNLEVALHSIFLALRPSKLEDSICNKPSNSMDELHEWSKGYIQMEEMSRFRNEVRQAGQKGKRHQDQLTQIRQKAQARQVPTFPKGTQVWALYTPDGKLNHYSWRGLQHGDTHKVAFDTSS